MTAEERAKRFSWASCPGGPDHDPGENDMAYTCWRCNADVIAAAEAAAYERCADLARGTFLEADFRALAKKGGEG